MFGAPHSRYRLRIAFAASILFASLHSAVAAPCSVVPTDSDKVTETMRQMYVAATNDDYAIWHRVTAPDFYAFDGGKRYEKDALMDLIKAAHASGSKLVWTVQEPQVHLGCDDAWISYVNRGSVENKTGITPITWLESGFLHKTDGEWKLVFFHSTRAVAAQ